MPLKNAPAGRYAAIPVWLRLVLLFCFLVVLTVLLLTVAGRFRGPSEQQRAALSVLAEAMPPVQGRDGSDALWVLSHDVPRAERAVAAEALRRYHERAEALKVAGREGEAKALVNPLSRYPEFPAVEKESPGLCPDKDTRCLATVRSDVQATTRTLATHAAGIRAVVGLSGYDGFRYGLTPSNTQALPMFGSQHRLLRPYFAAMFVRGDTRGALAGICADIGGWRRIGGNTDYLIGSMIGAAYVRQDLALLAEMVAELPDNATLPPPCDAALAPTAAFELDMCPAMRTEFRMFRQTIQRTLASADDRPMQRLFKKAAVNEAQLVAKAAPAYAPACDAALRAEAAEDVSWKHLSPPWPTCSLPEMASDPGGCVILAAGADMGYNKYFDRRTDLSAQIALMRTVLWLRARSANRDEWPGLLTKVPREVGLRRTATLSSDGSEISIPLLDQSKSDRFSLPIRP